ncbi:MAG TPA: TauD/TfdA family dioxygenase [Acidimicrobiia bacterium]|jgi:taurine dioxygenase
MTTGTRGANGIDPAEAAALGLEVRPQAGHIGAEIHGVDLTRPLAPEVVEAIRATLLRWKVVFFRDQHVTQDQHVAFGRAFGEVTPAHPTLPAAFPDHPEILLLDNERFARAERKGRDDAASGGARGGPSIESRWHTDVTFVPNPPMGSILRGVIVPEYGGDTQWTNLVVAYERLSAPVRALVDELHAVHHNVLPLSRGELSPELQQQFQAQDLRAQHPVVRVHPETGERALFVNPNFTSHIVELSRQEGRHLLAMLYEHLSNPEFTVRFRWQPDSIAFWDNRATAHLVPTDVPSGARRSMQRITLAGDVPVGPDGSESFALAGATFS